MIRAKDDRFSGFRVQAQKAADDLVRFQNLNGTQLVIYRNVQAFFACSSSLCVMYFDVSGPAELALAKLS